ncbi:hypothetical protein HED60_19340 [Planctomycetales bacterium ZRK34]|nr:hypothetical protein HED60_19340 [Planctomycetales bacterium ZRK34]
MILSSADIFASDDLPIKQVTVEAWGGDVYVKALSTGELNVVSKHTADVGELAGMCLVVAFGLCDEEGNRLIDAPAKNAHKLESKNVNTIKMLADEIIKISGLLDIEQAKNS